MKSVVKGTIGLVLIGAAIIGMLLSLAGLVMVWRIKQPVTSNLVAGLELIANTLENTARGLDGVDHSVQAVMASVTALDSTVLALADSINDMSPLTDSLAIVVGKDLPATVATVQTSLRATQSSARVVDDVLRAITSIPYFPGGPYNPPVLLHVALEEVSAGLDHLSESFAGMESSLRTTGDNLDAIESEARFMATEIRQINVGLEEARMVVGQYRDAMVTMQAKVKQIEVALPGWINLLAWGLSIILVWMGIAQIGLLMQGLSLIRLRKPNS